MYLVIEWQRATESGRVGQVTDDLDYAKEIADILGGLVAEVPIVHDARKTREGKTAKLNDQ